MRRLGFVTGTRADYGKIKPLLQELAQYEEVKTYLLVTGMHMLPEFGNTADAIRKDRLGEIYEFANQVIGDRMEFALATTIQELSRMLTDLQLDMLVVHGDRVEALAGAIVGSLNNILVGHLEGGEVSGSIDGSIRHSVSKLAHVHFVSNADAAERLRQLGESEDSVFVIGSPDVDVMLGMKLPTQEEVRRRYLITFLDYAILVFHPVTTELSDLKRQADTIVRVVLDTQLNWVIIGPNNDRGTDIITEALKSLGDHDRCRIFPSIDFECFLRLLKDAKCIVGNSSAGVREAQYFGVPAVNIGSRQKNRSDSQNIVNVAPQYDQIMAALSRVDKVRGIDGINSVCEFGDGRAAVLFRQIVTSGALWRISLDKTFVDRR